MLSAECWRGVLPESAYRSAENGSVRDLRKKTGCPRRQICRQRSRSASRSRGGHGLKWRGAFDALRFRVDPFQFRGVVLLALADAVRKTTKRAAEPLELAGQHLGQRRSPKY